MAARRDGGGYEVFGVVYRGSLWLDGVMKAHSESSDLTNAITDMLASSPHSGQVRIILLSQHSLPSEARVDASELYTRTGKPIIILGDGGSWTWKKGGEEIKYSAEGLSRWTAEAIIRVSAREGATPEALRVASLTLSAFTRGLDA